jgi:hypothetical protein
LAAEEGTIRSKGDLGTCGDGLHGARRGSVEDEEHDLVVRQRIAPT